MCLWANNSTTLRPSLEIREKSSAASLGAFARLVLPWDPCSSEVGCPCSGTGKAVGAVWKHALTAARAAGWRRAHSQKRN